jgi:hypothetical protein
MEQVGEGIQGEWTMQRKERFDVSRPPPLFFGVLSILLIMILVMATIMYSPESQTRRKDWPPPRTRSPMQQLKEQLRPLWSNLWIILVPFIPLLTMLALRGKRQPLSGCGKLPPQ